MPTSKHSETALPTALVAAGALAFALAATLNAGGYRYGTADQAFYIPAVLHQLDPSLFPRDWAMLGAQGRFFLVDEIFAELVRISGLDLSMWFLIAQGATLVALYTGGLQLGRAVLSTRLGLVAWMAALTLRHRIAKTGANTLEGYFHPRVLVCGLGLLALADFLRGGRWRPLIVTALSAALHPTTAACFMGIILVGLLVEEPRLRKPLLGALGVAAALGVASLALGVTPFDTTVMDAAWRDLLASKDYVFPTQWSVITWATNLAGPAVLIAAAMARRREGRLAPRELGVVAGCLMLVTGFLASLPLIAAGVPLAVQLQTSRVFWPVELVATLYALWWLVDRPAATASRSWAPVVVTAVLAATSVARAAYVGFMEFPHRPTFSAHLPTGDWADALAWVRQGSPTDAFVLADPGHAWKFGTAVRIGAARDVFLEDVKDVAMAIYSRDVAHRVRTRIDALAGFAEMDTAEVQALAAREGLTLLVTERTFDLPVLHRAGRVFVYRLTS